MRPFTCPQCKKLKNYSYKGTASSDGDALRGVKAQHIYCSKECAIKAKKYDTNAHNNQAVASGSR